MFETRNKENNDTVDSIKGEFFFNSLFKALLAPLGFHDYCVKSFQIRSFSGPYFPASGLNTDQKNSVFRQFLRSGH